MPTLMPLVTQAPPMSYIFLNKDTAEPLTSGFVFFYHDDAKTVLKPVYQLAPDYSYQPLSNPLQLGANGAFVDENGSQIVIYLYPYKGFPSDEPPSGKVDLYYIEVYSTDNVLQEVIRAWPSGVVDGSITNDLGETDNLLANPQFSQVNFNPNVSCTLTVTGSPQVSSIAPGWDIITNGAGTITVSRTSVSTANIVTNPPYYLNISSTSLSEPIVLRQRLYNSPRLLVNGFVSGYFICASTGTSQIPVTLSYKASGGTPTNFNIVTITTPADGSFADTTGLVSTISINPSTINPDPPETGYVDILLSFPVSSNTISISSVQIAGVLTEDTGQKFLQMPVSRETDLLFHNYFNSLVIQPKQTILTGWDFGLNPWQFMITSLTTIPLNQYITDQTVLIQQNYVATGNGINLAAAKAIYNGSQALQLTAMHANNQFALIQYVDATTVAPYWNLSLSSLVNATISTAVPTACRIKMRLIYRASIPSVIGQNEPITAWTEGGDPLFGAGWTVVTPLNDPKYTLSQTDNNYPFVGMKLPASISATMTIALVVYTIDNISNTGTPDSILFKKISLVPNEFATDTTPKTFDDVLRECQYYYETTYAPGTANGIETWGAQFSNYLLLPQKTGGVTSLYSAAAQFNWNSIKRSSVPTYHVYDPATGTIHQFQGYLYGANHAVATQGPISFSDKYALAYSSNKGSMIYGTTDGALLTIASTDLISAYIALHYTSDARLGLIT